MLKFIRNYSFLVGNEVKSALNAAKPVVALESTILTHGLPYPQNLDMALEVEEILRSKGVVPATTAFINGSARVGLQKPDLKFLAELKSATKVSKRDIPYVLAKKLNGGTTIAATMILAHKAGINVFATGGLGGVHREVSSTWDVSADLEELSRTPVAVVCSGPKSILDIPKTIEYLETKGVFVSTLGQRNVPGFFTTDSKVSSPYTFNSASEAAQIIHESLQFGSNAGQVFCVPAHKDLALSNEVVDSAINHALQAAEAAGISGKELTPYLLKQVWQATNGKSVDVNIEFVKQNARMAADIAIDLANLKATNVSTSKTSEHLNLPPLDVLCIGGINEDITGTISSSEVAQKSSNPAEISSSLGGTAYNVALAAGISGGKHKTGIMGTLNSKQQIHENLDSHHVHTSAQSSKYMSINDKNGELLLGCSNSNVDLPTAKIVDAIKNRNPKVIVFDGNLNKDQIEAITNTQNEQCQSKLIFEPTSVPKARKLAVKGLKVFPENTLYAATPNIHELDAMVSSFTDADLFDIDNWLPVLLDSSISSKDNRKQLHSFSHLHPNLTKLEHDGVIKTATRLLPYIPNLFITLGDKGVLSLQLLDKWEKEQQSIEFMSTLLTDSERKYAVRVRYFPAVQNINVQSVNGAGDSFCGVLASGLALKGQNTPELVLKAIKAANLSLITKHTVNPEISEIHN